MDVTNFQVVETTTVTMTSGLASGAAFPVGTTTVEYTASSCGGSETCSFDVTVNDSETPTISCPSNITGRGTDSGQCYATVNGIAPTANDNCTPTITYTLSGATTGSGSNDASGTQFNLGTTTVTYTITDPSSNTANCNFTIEVVDDEAPTVTCQDITLTLSTATVNIVPSDVHSSSSDNCGTVNLVSVSPNSFSCSDVGDNTVTLTVNDGNGNTNTCTATVTIQDNLTASVTSGSTELTCNEYFYNFRCQRIKRNRKLKL